MSSTEISRLEQEVYVLHWRLNFQDAGIKYIGDTIEATNDHLSRIVPAINATYESYNCASTVLSSHSTMLLNQNTVQRATDETLRSNSMMLWSVLFIAVLVFFLSYVALGIAMAAHERMQKASSESIFNLSPLGVRVELCNYHSTPFGRGFFLTEKGGEV